MFGAMCITFGVGAASGAIMTEVMRSYSLAIPVTLLATVLLLCRLTTEGVAADMGVEA
ncbi:MAG: hypothetical protein WDN50_16800 [Bradyrhizobium sp.]